MPVPNSDVILSDSLQVRSVLSAAASNTLPSKHALEVWHKADAVCFDVDCESEAKTVSIIVLLILMFSISSSP